MLWPSQSLNLPQLARQSYTSTLKTGASGASAAVVHCPQDTDMISIVIPASHCQAWAHTWDLHVGSPADMLPSYLYGVGLRWSRLLAFSSCWFSILLSQPHPQTAVKVPVSALVHSGFSLKRSHWQVPRVWNSTSCVPLLLCTFVVQEVAMYPHMKAGVCSPLGQLGFLEVNWLHIHPHPFMVHLLCKSQTYLF